MRYRSWYTPAESGGDQRKAYPSKGETLRILIEELAATAIAIRGSSFDALALFTTQLKPVRQSLLEVELQQRRGAEHSEKGPE